MSHGREQRDKTRLLTPVFTIYAILLQLTKAQLLRKRFAALCIAPIVYVFMYYRSNMPLHLCASFSTLPPVYGMMETRMGLQTEPQARRRRGGLCRAGRSS